MKSLVILSLALGYLALFCLSDSYAGITFSGMGKAPDQSMLIPDFSSPRDAINFANRVKGNSEAIADMKRHMDWLKHLAEHPKEITAPEEEWRKQYRLQWSRTQVALAELIKKDKAQIGNHGRFQFEIPYFNSRGDAIRWANKVGYTEALRRQLRNRSQWFRDLAYLGSDPTLYQIEMSKHYAQQYELCQWALSIMNNMRAHGLVGEPVGAGFMASSIPVKRKLCIFY